MRSYSIKAYCCHWYVTFVQYHIINLEILADAFLIFTKWLADITVRAQYFYLSSTYHNRNFLTVREHSFPLSYDKSSLPFIKMLVSSFFGKNRLTIDMDTTELIACSRIEIALIFLINELGALPWWPCSYVPTNNCYLGKQYNNNFHK